MRLLHYNVLDGCQGDPERLTRLGAWLSDEAYDLVGFNELNGWSTPSLCEAAARWGYSQAHVFELSSGYSIGFIARKRFTVLNERADGFHHGVLTVNLDGLRIIETHLTPMSAAGRHGECERLAAMATASAAPTLLMGDLNTLSRLDAESHAAGDFASTLAATPSLRRKFCDADGAIDYGPMDTLLNAGFYDLGAHNVPRHTVPTPMNTDAMHALPLRLDYILGTHELQELSARPRHDEAVAELSDHYPVEVTIP